ncbi:hypothetical protein HYV43_07170 [Candidatus Micrarchaeota archaeon]|nr:hypothetical protein [Candidatus Micrarchaeota archaeon]
MEKSGQRQEEIGPEIDRAETKTKIERAEAGEKEYDKNAPKSETAGSKVRTKGFDGSTAKKTPCHNLTQNA